jgi:hypothetical protein
LYIAEIDGKEGREFLVYFCESRNKFIIVAEIPKCLIDGDGTQINENM